MNLQDIYFLTSIISQILFIGLFLFLIIATLKIYQEVKGSLLSVRQAAALAQQKSIVSLPPLNASLFAFNLIKNLIKKRNERQQT